MVEKQQEADMLDLESKTVQIPPLVDIPIEEKANILPPPIPPLDGGLRAWLQVLGCYLVFFNVW